MRENHLGEIGYNRFGTPMKIVEYNRNHSIVVEFLDGNNYRQHTDYRHFKEGTVTNKFDKTFLGVAYIGNATIMESTNGKHKTSYKYWQYMISRCFSEEYQTKQPTYKDCELCEEWLCYENFEKWFNENYYEVENTVRMELDKDILFKGNKIYSPNTCVFVPKEINVLFTKRQNHRGKLPIGVKEHIQKNKIRYEARCNYQGKSNYIGIYDTIQEAFDAYKNFKEKCLKEVAEEYKDKIPHNLYLALNNYNVEITD